MANTMLGGWGLFHELSNEDKAAFANGIEGFVGVSYKPVAVATQVVATATTPFSAMPRWFTPALNLTQPWFTCLKTWKEKSALRIFSVWIIKPNPLWDRAVFCRPLIFMLKDLRLEVFFSRDFSIMVITHIHRHPIQSE